MEEGSATPSGREASGASTSSGAPRGERRRLLCGGWEKVPIRRPVCAARKIVRSLREGASENTPAISELLNDLATARARLQRAACVHTGRFARRCRLTTSAEIAPT